MIEGELRQKYINNMKKHYEDSLNKFNNKHLDELVKNPTMSTMYESVEDFKPKEPGPPCKLEDIPEWYPELLKLYLTEVSTECIIDTNKDADDLFEFVHNPYDENGSYYEFISKITLLGHKYKSIEEVQNEAISKYFERIGKTKEEQENYFNKNLNRKYNTYNFPVENIEINTVETCGKTLEELIEIEKELSYTSSTFIWLALDSINQDIYCPVRNKVIRAQWFKLLRSGLIEQYETLNQKFEESDITLEKYLGITE
jgi:hypothetical protein